VRTFRPHPLWLLPCLLWLTGCVNKNDATSSPGASGSISPGMKDTPGGSALVPTVHEQKKAQMNPEDTPRGAYLLPSKYMLMTPPTERAPAPAVQPRKVLPRPPAPP
jgi:hypothetical protein